MMTWHYDFLSVRADTSKLHAVPFFTTAKQILTVFFLCFVCVCVCVCVGGGGGGRERERESERERRERERECV